MAWIEKEMNIWWNIKNVFHHLVHPFKRFFHWINKSAHYSKLLWNDFDWDFTYILIMLQYKIKRTRKQIQKNNIILRSEEVASQMKHVEDLITKWIDDDFCTTLHEQHEEKWGRIKSFTKEVEVNGQVFHEFCLIREKTTTEEQQEQERNEHHEIYQKHEKEKQECWEEIFKHLSEYMQEWWD